MAALAGVLGSGPVNDVLLGAAISIVLLLRQAARPRVTELAAWRSAEDRSCWRRAARRSAEDLPREGALP
jgi:hypothetical protein